MQELVSGMSVILILLVAIPTITLCLEITIGVLRRPDLTKFVRATHSKVAVLVPARNEGVAIAPTLKDIKRQLRANDTLLVVADNCVDNTAAVARDFGADVVERHDANRIGKGYALDFGLRHLEKNPPDIVIMVDADCRLADDAIDNLVSCCASTARPVQALNLMTAPDGTQRIAELAWRVKNWVRPLGLKALGLPCQLMGTGMAFPWKLIRAADLAHQGIVEDLKLGLDLTAAGHPPFFCPTAHVTSQFATTRRGADIQRRRWEQGHIATIIANAPRLLSAATVRGDFGLFALALDLAVPPLSLLALLLILIFFVTGCAAALGFGHTALIVSSICIICFAAAVGLAWGNYGRDVLPPRAILSIPGYIFRKLGLYWGVLRGKMPAHWIGTDRAK